MKVKIDQLYFNKTKLMWSIYQDSNCINDFILVSIQSFIWLGRVTYILKKLHLYFLPIIHDYFIKVDKANTAVLEFLLKDKYDGFERVLEREQQVIAENFKLNILEMFIFNFSPMYYYCFDKWCFIFPFSSQSERVRAARYGYQLLQNTSRTSVEASLKEFLGDP